MSLLLKEQKEKLGLNKIADIEMPIVIPATDLKMNKEILFTNKKIKGKECIGDMEIAKAVRASSSFPGMYTPFKYKEYQFVDGGISNNLPVKEVRETGVDKVIGVTFDVVPQRKNNTIYNVTMQAIDLMAQNIIKDQRANSDYLLDIDLKGVRVFDVNKVEYCYEEGYKQAIKHMDEIKEALKLNN